MCIIVHLSCMPFYHCSFQESHLESQIKYAFLGSGAWAAIIYSLVHDNTYMWREYIIEIQWAPIMHYVIMILSYLYYIVYIIYYYKLYDVYYVSLYLI